MTVDPVRRTVVTPSTNNQARADRLAGMALHGTVDDATIRLSSALLGSKKFFATSLDSDPLPEIAAEATAPIDDLGTEGVQSVTVETPTGDYEAAYGVRSWKGPSSPAVIFHHGSGEDPFSEGRFDSTSVDRIFGDGSEIPGSVIAVRAPFHDRSSREYARSMGDVADFVGMLAASTAVTDALVDRLHDLGVPAVVVSGISLGGWVTNLHRAVDDSADLYAPIFAGDRLGELFVSSVYRRMTGRRARQHPDRVRHTLDFVEAFDRADAPVSGLLGRYDRIIEYEVQRQAYGYGELTTVDYGHVTGSLASDRLREHVLEALRTAPGRE